MTNVHRVLAAVSFVALAPDTVAQTQLWSQQLGTSSTDEIHGVASDGSGGVFLSGDSWGSLGGASAGLEDPWLARYDSVGNQVWIRQFGFNGFESASFAAADGTGGVYVGGGRCNVTCSAIRAWFAHYDGAGNELWTHTVPLQSGAGSDGALAAAPGPQGGVYVGGHTEHDLGGPNAGELDAWFGRYDSAGNELWIRQFGTSERDWVSGATPDPSGGVYVCGRVGDTGASVGDAWLARYDSGGVELWNRQLSTGANTLAAAVCSDGSGGLYVCGFTNVSLGGQPLIGGTDAFLARYDDAGVEVWTRILGTSAGDRAESVAPNESGGVFVTGVTTSNTLGNFHDDVWLVRFDALGNSSWSQDLGTSVEDGVGAVASDGSGGVYVGGSTEGSLGGPSAGGWDAWFARYDGVLYSRHCSPAVTNSTGHSAVMDAIGSNTVARNDVTLIAHQLPPGQFGYFLVSRTQGLSMPNGSQGFLCLGGNIGRFASSVIQGPSGSVQIDLTSIPVSPPTAVLSGETWYFQCWFRDNDPGPTSHFTDAVGVTFR